MNPKKQLSKCARPTTLNGNVLQDQAMRNLLVPPNLSIEVISLIILLMGSSESKYTSKEP